MLNDDVIGRFSRGEVGTALPNDYPEKYGWLVELPGTVPMPLKRCPGYARRRFYFYAHEVELV